MELLDIEKEILLLYANEYKKGIYKEAFLSQIKFINSIKRDFTGVGVFVCFDIKNKNGSILKIDKIKNSIRLDGLFLYSNELLHECPISIVINNGILDYIEFEFGFKERRYPNIYKLQWGDFNTIIDL